MHTILRHVALVGCAGLLWAAQTAGASEHREGPPTPRELTYQVVESADHDSSLFTQGLLMKGEFLLESAGGYGRSLVRRYHADTGAVAAEQRFPEHIFAEGLAQVGQKLYVLSWRRGLCFRLDAETLVPESRYTYAGEGWGLTYNGEHLIMSNGSDRLQFRDPQSFAPLRELQVTGGGEQWFQLNELEYARDLVWANIWQDSRIIAIDPQTGAVLATLDLSELVMENSKRPDHTVLNGIAYDRERDAFWVTGKLWPKRYLISIVWPELPGENAGPRAESE